MDLFIKKTAKSFTKQWWADIMVKNSSRAEFNALNKILEVVQLHQGCVGIVPALYLYIISGGFH